MEQVWIRRARALVAGIVVLVTIRLAAQGGPTVLEPAPTSPATSAPEAIGRPPARNGEEFACAPSAPFAVYVPERWYFAPNHPSHPPSSVRPYRCFEDPTTAEAVGYRPALPPTGALVVRGVYLVPVDLVAACAREADRLGFAVPCPTRLPGAGKEVNAARCAHTSPPGAGCVVGESVRTFLFSYSGFAIPPWYGSRSSLVVTAFRAYRLGTEPSFDATYRCTNGRPWGMTEFAGPPTGRLILCPDFAPPPLAGHLIMRWSRGGVVYQVGFGGDSPIDREVLQTIVRTSVVLVEPRSG